MNTITQIIITTSFPAFHYWPEAPVYCDFLQNVHRHIFHVELKKEVLHDNRDIEFITLKQKIDDYVENNFKNRKFTYSCEQIADMLLYIFNANEVKVMEDNENGALVKKCQKVLI